MKKTAPIALVATLLFVLQPGFGQERFNDVRQHMADRLTAVKTAVRDADRSEAQVNLTEAKKIWEAEVRPMISDGVKTNSQFQEYFDRLGDVETNLAALDDELAAGESGRIETLVNAVIWGISHHPRGFDVPPPRYTAWDWVFGLSIGVGFCVFAMLFGLHLRRSYYRRYTRPGTEARKG
jgi:hypothetical protein